MAIIGHVRQPGVFAIDVGRLDVAHALSLASGLRASASGTLRIVRNGQSSITTDLAAPGGAGSLVLRDGDVLVVEGRESTASPTPPVPSQSLESAADVPLCIAVINLLPRPVVIPIPDEFATVSGVLQVLQQSPGTCAGVVSAAAGGASQDVSGADSADWPLAAGDVLVLNPATIDVSRIPKHLPPVLQRTLEPAPADDLAFRPTPPATATISGVSDSVDASRSLPENPRGSAEFPDWPAQPLHRTSAQLDRVGLQAAVPANPDSPAAVTSRTLLEILESDVRISDRVDRQAPVSADSQKHKAARVDPASDGSEFTRASVTIGIACVAMLAAVLWWKCSWGEPSEQFGRDPARGLSAKSAPPPTQTPGSTRDARLEALRRLHRLQSLPGASAATRQDATHVTPESATHTSRPHSNGPVTREQSREQSAGRTAPGLLDRALARLHTRD